MKYPSPAWLSEPAHEGTPTPEELRKYTAYLRYQLKRGVVGVAERAIHNAKHLLDGGGNSLLDSSVDVLRQLTSPKRFNEIQTGIPHKRLTCRLGRMAQCGYVQNLAPGAKRGSVWVLTERGQAEIARRDAQ